MVSVVFSISASLLLMCETFARPLYSAAVAAAPIMMSPTPHLQPPWECLWKLPKRAVAGVAHGRDLIQRASHARNVLRLRVTLQQNRLAVQLGAHLAEHLLFLGRKLVIRRRIPDPPRALAQRSGDNRDLSHVPLPFRVHVHLLR